MITESELKELEQAFLKMILTYIDLWRKHNYLKDRLKQLGDETETYTG